MKKVFSNSAMVAHVWAQRNQAEGRTGTGNMYFNGDTIYSYGSHFPIATFITNKKGETKLLYNESGYSVTTAKHQTEVRQASTRYEYIYCNTDTIKRIVNYGSWIKRNDKDHTALLIKALASQVEHDIVLAAKLASKRRKANLVENDIGDARYSFNQANLLLQFYGLKMPSKVVKLLDSLVNDYKGLLAVHEKQVKAAKKKQDKLAAIAYAEKQAKAKEVAKRWLNNEELEYREKDLLYYLPSVLLRSNGDNIETTKGASFPIEHAKKAFKFILDCKTNAKEWHTNGHSIKLGNFSIDSIDIYGNVVAGCHKVEWPVIEDMAKKLGLL